MIKECIVKKKVGNDGQVFSTKEVGELVRCKNCKCWIKTGHGTFCFNVCGLYTDTAADDYCSYADRKEND